MAPASWWRVTSADRRHFIDARRWALAITFTEDISISSTPGLREPSHNVAATFVLISCPAFFVDASSQSGHVGTSTSCLLHMGPSESSMSIYFSNFTGEMHSSLKPTTTINTQSTLIEAQFEGLTHICFFAAFQPQKFAGSLPCLSSHKEVSHNISHAVPITASFEVANTSAVVEGTSRSVEAIANFPAAPHSVKNVAKFRRGKTKTWRIVRTPVTLSASVAGAASQNETSVGISTASRAPTMLPLKQAHPEKSRKRKRGLELSPLCSAASPVTTTPATFTIQPNEDLVWPFSLKKIKLSFILDSDDGS
ncbi:hypothetical protein B0J15DRAFT_470874 [Fusarium solani]|uniref:Uncharacterized protein n=1 Tax=Fusarium solani TaxID=169388 RepID=A0A9P9GG10_FUSSL|nr:uncharacterized protein B0J15DRAFT_470874 [Fusarium solani]KAH7237842.1 hypothetical protein B0J15DRAFT_470874 [Fusarium solani]